MTSASHVSFFGMGWGEHFDIDVAKKKRKERKQDQQKQRGRETRNVQRKYYEGSNYTRVGG